MKKLIKQVIFLDKILLPIFGISSIYDYNTTICLQDLDEKALLEKINDVLPQFKQTFPVNNFNLHKTNHKILSVKQAFNLLKNCLTIAFIPFHISKSKQKKYLRLVCLNNILSKHVDKNQMTEKRIFENEKKEEIKKEEKEFEDESEKIEGKITA